MHIIPDLREIENTYSIEDGLAVVGVHSAKFENEKNSSNILAAVQRYNIGHPVVNDHNSTMWRNCDVQCWPTMVLLGPNANPILMLTGEGHKEDLLLIVKNALEFYKQQGMISNHKLPVQTAYHLLPDLKGPLLFPGKITNVVDENNHEILAVSDTGNSRILIMKPDGTILKQIGGNRLGFKDGTCEEAEFNNPQGLAFQNKDVLFVADTENHAIRRINFKKNIVETVAGTGEQGHDYEGGKLWTKQEISSPWDVCIYRTPGNPPLKDVLIIAMAGIHQIWALFLEDTVWWKCKLQPAGTCVRIAGSGREENRNNNYPHAAAFAQPSGLALSLKNREVYIADSESSSIRRLSLVDGKVTPVVGGDKNPNNLFAFGDKDGAIYEAKLQHVLGVALSRDEQHLFVADTYNHKVKRVDVTKNTVTSLPTPPTTRSNDTTDGAIAFKEPAGLCVSADNKRVYVADTNNHVIKTLYLDSKLNVNKVEKMHLKKQGQETDGPHLKKIGYEVLTRKPIKISKDGGKIIISVKINLGRNVKLTDDTPQSWAVDLPDFTWSAVPKSGSELDDIDVVISVPPHTNGGTNDVDFVFDLVICGADTCIPRKFLMRVPVEYSEKGSIHVSETIGAEVGQGRIKML
ncbi:unnamed protein product [Acanthoscelides obtectus]|uniref:Thioredoxin-like fold domain-containing protein n=1 Tax=Acanthoscelides obtectus TaxID=200917 RepID=A0A9P0PIY4_ACAOB|nr:unnamed protein product [Acanthoscelides obtectus]CAK1639374.1 NHL repeat-containing protein 2 [Acanthoscelides obtectus]